jgi:putative transposase
VRRSSGGPGEATEGAGAGEREAEASGCELELREVGTERHRGGKLLSLERRRSAVDHAQQQGISERWACRVAKQPRGTQRYRPTQREDEDRLTQAIVVLAGQYGRYGYRRITALLVMAGWKVGNHVWSYDFVSVRTHDGRMARALNLIDEHTREALVVRVERRWSSAKVIEALADVMVMKGVTEHLRSDNGPEFVAHDLRKWLAKIASSDS